MTLSKREKALLFLFIAVIFLGAYYKFLIIPQNEKLAQFKIDRELKQQEYTKLHESLKSEKKLDDEYKEISSKLLDIAENYFGKIEQEDIILIINDFLLNEHLKIPLVNFSPLRTVVFQSNGAVNFDDANNSSDDSSIYVDVIGTDFNYETSYKGLMNLLKEINNYNKKIIINKLNLSNNTDGILSGSIGLDFYSVSQVNKYYPVIPSALSKNSTEEERTEKLYNPFDGYFFVGEGSKSTELQPRDVHVSSGNIGISQGQVIYKEIIDASIKKENEWEYVVREGDTIYIITKAFYNDYRYASHLIEYNQIVDPNFLRIGQVLRIPFLNNY